MDNKSIEMINSISATQVKMSLLLAFTKERMDVSLITDMKRLNTSLGDQIEGLINSLKVKRETIESAMKQIFFYLELLERDYPIEYKPGFGNNQFSKDGLTAHNINNLSFYIEKLCDLIACPIEDSKTTSKDNSLEEKEKFNEINKELLLTLIDSIKEISNQLEMIRIYKL